jgi:hypothetical protein
VGFYSSTTRSPVAWGAGMGVGYRNFLWVGGIPQSFQEECIPHNLAPVANFSASV